MRELCAIFSRLRNHCHIKLPDRIIIKKYDKHSPLASWMWRETNSESRQQIPDTSPKRPRNLQFQFCAYRNNWGHERSSSIYPAYRPRRCLLYSRRICRPFLWWATLKINIMNKWKKSLKYYWIWKFSNAFWKWKNYFTF